MGSFLTEAVECVTGLQGTVDKFLGDAIGAPLAQEDHGLRGLVCGVEMQRRHAGWMERRRAAGQPACGLGIGIATGPAIVGNIDTAKRMEYTALGHTVNLAARLCGAAAAGETLTVPETHAAAQRCLRTSAAAAAVPRLGFEPRGKMSFKNVAEPVEVVAVRARE